MSNELISIDRIPDVLKELEDAFYDIPFENSAFQTRAFVIAAQRTPARAYRAIGLQMISKIQSVKASLFTRQRRQIDVEEKRAKIEDPNTNSFERRRLEIDIAEIQDGENHYNKLLNDAIQDLNVLYAEFKKFPNFTREQFEAEEAFHFDARLKRQLQGEGAHESLLNMHEDVKLLEQRVQLAIAHFAQEQIGKGA